MTTAEWITRNLATAPPLTEAQLARIGGLFRVSATTPASIAA